MSDIINDNKPYVDDWFRMFAEIHFEDSDNYRRIVCGNVVLWFIKDPYTGVYTYDGWSSAINERSDDNGKNMPDNE
jgi:hypothetical protein